VDDARTGAAVQQRTKVVEGVLRLMAERFPNGEHKNRARCEALLPHARAVLRHASGRHSSIKDYGTLLHNIGWFDWGQGRYMRAQESVQKAYDLRRQVLGNEDVSTIASLGLFGTILKSQGYYKQAEEMYRQALRLEETILGKEHPSTLASMNNLATALSNQGKYEQAEEMHRQALRLSETVLGKEHPDTLTSMDNLAMVLRYRASTSRRKRCLDQHSG
jgi:tetratricopeptide (TPR) repeat protein